MLFSSVNFIFLFLPALLAVYFAVPGRLRWLRNLLLLIASLGFYAYGEPKYVLVMLGSILLNYLFGLAVSRFDGRAGKWWVAGAVVCNIGILAYFKYTTFFVGNLNRLFGLSVELWNIVMPIGISFFTFQGLSYVLDVYRGGAAAQRNPLNVALYVSLFPQLIAGPIVRYETVADEIRNRRETLDDFADGISRFVVGLAKKVLLANTIGQATDAAFAVPAGELSAALAWLGAAAYAFQVYFDFSGYSDMAIGLGKMFGFHFLENFDYPYLSKSITEFWRRWHISLGTWFRDYVYIPLGGNRGGTARHLRNILVVWCLTGFWHGAAWNFLVWGLYFGVLLIGEKYLWGALLKRLPGAVQHLYALVLILVGWVLFRANDLPAAGAYLRAMFGFGAGGFLSGQALYVLLEYGAFFAVALVASLPVVPAVQRLLDRRSACRAALFVRYHARNLCLAGLFALSVVYLVSSTFNPFIYFRF
ncbi:MBOAT family O-acyltransferase [Feifania hominis]|uniref:MBOAT family protein n=1 Tax=Feifania hominis TaxID=2763660 RepID=A0A926HSX5_9FIRM|nr:MBOAT family O-acyltransferase [Feifania hominis]MBC8535279.1 MBOAT family protein [Feifania hominis]